MHARTCPQAKVFCDPKTSRRAAKTAALGELSTGGANVPPAAGAVPKQDILSVSLPLGMAGRLNVLLETFSVACQEMATLQDALSQQQQQQQQQQEAEEQAEAAAAERDAAAGRRRGGGGGGSLVAAAAVCSDQLAEVVRRLTRGTSLVALARLEAEVAEHFGVEAWLDLGHGASLLATLTTASEPCLRGMLGPAVEAGGGGCGGCGLEDVLRVIHAISGGWEEGGCALPH